MTQIIEAVYENGILRPTQPLLGVKEHASVKITIETSEPQPKFSHFRDLEKISDEDAAEMIRVIEEEFE